MPKVLILIDYVIYECVYSYSLYYLDLLSTVSSYLLYTA
jgi:hypothetical protein